MGILLKHGNICEKTYDIRFSTLTWPIWPIVTPKSLQPNSLGKILLSDLKLSIWNRDVPKLFIILELEIP